MKRIGAVALSALLAGAVGLRAGQPEPFAVDSAASRVRVHLGRAGLLKFLGHDHEIDAPIAEGRVMVVEGDPARSSVRLRFDARRLSVVPGIEPGRYRLRVRGTLELKGRSFPVEIPLEVRQAGGEIQAGGEAEWRLRDLGIEPPSVAGVVNVANGFRMTFDLLARREGPSTPLP